MAKIKIDVELNVQESFKNIDKLKTGFEQIGKTLNTIKPNRDLTEQLKALTKYYEELGKVASKYTKTINDQKIAEEKIAQQQEKTRQERAKTNREINKTIEAMNQEKIATDRAYASLSKFVNINQNKINSLATKIYNLKKSLDRTKTGYKDQSVFTTLGTDISSTITKLEEFNRSYNAYFQANKDNTTKQNLQNEQYIELSKTYGELDLQVSNLTKKYAELTATQQKNNDVLVKHNDSVLSLAKKFLTWQMAATMVMQPIYKIRNAVESLNETLVKTETQVIAIQRVLNNGGVEISNEDISKKLYDLAIKYGQTFENVGEIVTNFARTGMEWQDVLKATESALTALNVAELDTTQATEGLIAIMNQFKYEASDLSKVVDILNKQADTASVTTEELLIGLQKTGSAAANANLSLEETVGLITTLSETTGASGSVMGNAIRALLTYSSKDKSLDTFAGLSDNMNDVVTKYRQGLASMLDIWKELSSEMKNLSSEQADTIEEATNGLDEELSGELEELYSKMKGVWDTAGTYRKNYFMALISDIDTIQEKLDTTQNAIGYSQEENAKAMETYEKKVASLKALWEAIANDEQGILGLKKVLVDISYGFLKIFELTGGIKTAIVAITGLVTTLFADKLIKGFNKITSFFKGIGTGSGLSLNIVKNYKTATELLTIARNKDAIAATKQAAYQSVLNQQGATAETITIAKTQAEEAATVATNAHTAALEAQKIALQSVITWVTLGITAIISLVTIIQKSIEAQRQAREEIINKYKEQVNEYGDVISAAQKVTLKMENAEKGLASALGDTAKAFDNAGLSAEEYKSKLQGAAKETLETLNAQALLAKEAAKKDLTDLSPIVYDQKQTYGGKYIGEDIAQYMGDSVSMLSPSRMTREGIFENAYELKGGNTLEIYSYLKLAIKNLNEALGKNASLSKNKDFMRLLEIYNNVLEGSNISTYISATAHSAGLQSFLSDEDGIIDKNDYEETIKSILEELGISENLAKQSGVYDDIEKSLSEIYKIEDLTQTSEETKEVVKDIRDKIFKNLEELLTNIREIKENSDKERELAELQEKLLNAEKNQNVRVYNEETGNWDRVADSNKVSEATNNIRNWLEDEAYNTIEEAIQEAIDNEEGLSYNDLISILTTWKESRKEAIEASGGAGYLKPIVENVDDFTGVRTTNKEKDEITDAPPVSVEGEVISGTVSIIAGIAAAIAEIWGDSTPEYDSGGVLHGLGGIKATTEDEIVLPPNLANKILEPSSNEQFKAFADSLGLLFGVSKEVAQPQFSTNANSNVVNNNGNSYTINGVTIGQYEAENYTIAELFRTMNLQ